MARGPVSSVFGAYKENPKHVALGRKFQLGITTPTRGRGTSISFTVLKLAIVAPRSANVTPSFVTRTTVLVPFLGVIIVLMSVLLES